MIPIEKEPKELRIEFRIYELCNFCKKETDTWHKKTNTPVCLSCAKSHKVSELKDQRTWKVLTMDEIQNFITDGKSKVFDRVSFPTKRWGRTFTKTSTDDLTVINMVLAKYKEKGYTVRKRVDCITTKKFHYSFGSFYFIQIKR